MREHPKIAIPVREGVIFRDGRAEVVWQEHLWNNGEKTRAWFVNPRDACSFKITERKVELGGS